MPRVAVSINPGYSIPSVASRMGPSGRRVRDLSAIVTGAERETTASVLNRAVRYLLAKLFTLVVWIGCFLTGALGYVYLRFY